MLTEVRRAQYRAMHHSLYSKDGQGLLRLCEPFPTRDKHVYEEWLLRNHRAVAFQHFLNSRGADALHRLRSFEDAQGTGLQALLGHA